MPVLPQISSLFRNLFAKPTVEKELDDEIESHLELLADQKIKEGMNRGDARRCARIELGGVEHVKENVRAVRLGVWLETLWQDVSFGVRMLRKNPGFTVVTVLTLALGIGANTAIFAVAYATLLAPLPYPEANRLVNVWSDLRGSHSLVSAGDFTDWKQSSTAFRDLNAWGERDFNIATRDRPEDIVGVQATPTYYAMLGGSLLLGRDFLLDEGEAGKEHVVILTNRLWKHLGGNSQIVGQTIQMNDELYTVVGVMTPGAADREDWELIVPLVLEPKQLIDHGDREWRVTGRLNAGVSVQQAQGELDAITAREATMYPNSSQGWTAIVEPFRRDNFQSDRQLMLWLLLAAVGCLLLIACLNVANLLLAKNLTRQTEVAIRSALGATQKTLFAQFVTESLALAFLGGVLGIGAGYVSLQGLIAVIPPHALPPEADLRVSIPVLLVMLIATTVAGLIFGYPPAWYASRVGPAEVLQDGGRSGPGLGRRWLRRVLVTAQFALALPLLAGAGLAIHSFWNLTHVDLGVRTDHLLGFYVIPGRLPAGSLKINSYYERVLASIKSVPGVSIASAMSYLPLDFLHAEMRFSIPGEAEFANPALRPTADFESVTPDFFETFGVRIVKGRRFSDADNTSSVRVAIVNEAFVSHFLTGLDPLRQRVQMGQLTEGTMNGPTADWQIVGVFHTVKSRGSRQDNPEIDTPFWQEAFPISAIAVRTKQDPGTMVRSMAAAVNSVDSKAALALTRTMEQVHDDELANDRFTLVLLAGFGVLGLLLATLGIYGMTAYSVAQRKREIAVRMALGASRNHVLALVVKEAVMLACAGLGFGLIGAYFVGRTMEGILFGVRAVDFSTIAAVGASLLLGAVSACYLPARRATGIDPAQALRHE